MFLEQSLVILSSQRVVRTNQRALQNIHDVVLTPQRVRLETSIVDAKTKPPVLEAQRAVARTKPFERRTQHVALKSSSACLQGSVVVLDNQSPLIESRHAFLVKKRAVEGAHVVVVTDQRTYQKTSRAARTTKPPAQLDDVVLLMKDVVDREPCVV